jgi:hypothetical protein
MTAGVIYMAIVTGLCLWGMGGAGSVVAWQKDLGLVAPWLDGYSLRERISQTDSEVFIARVGERFLRIEKIEGIPQESARILAEDEILSLKALYANMLSPYPGEISHKIVCNTQYEPRYFSQQNEHARWDYAFVYSTQRFTPGACQEDLLGYRHIPAWIFCHGKDALYIVRYYAPLATPFEDMEREILSLTCTSK